MDEKCIFFTKSLGGRFGVFHIPTMHIPGSLLYIHKSVWFVIESEIEKNKFRLDFKLQNSYLYKCDKFIWNSKNGSQFKASFRDYLIWKDFSRKKKKREKTKQTWALLYVLQLENKRIYSDLRA